MYQLVSTTKFKKDLKKVKKHCKYFESAALVLKALEKFN